MFRFRVIPTGTDKVQKIIDNPNYGFWTREGLAYSAEGRELMNIAFAGVRPVLYAHGHFHVTDEAQVGDTKFLSLGPDGAKGNCLTLDLETLEHEWLLDA